METLRSTLFSCVMSCSILSRPDVSYFVVICRVLLIEVDDASHVDHAAALSRTHKYCVMVDDK